MLSKQFGKLVARLYKRSEVFSLDIAKHIVRVGKLANEQRHGEGVTERQAACDAKYGSQQNNLQIPEVVTIPRAFGLKFGTVFSQVLLQWWLQTGHVFLKRECRLKWISFTQLFCDFFDGYWTPRDVADTRQMGCGPLLCFS